MDLTYPLLPPQKKKIKLSQNLPLITQIKGSNPRKPKDWDAEENIDSEDKKEKKKDAESKYETSEVTALRGMLERLLAKVDKLEDQVRRLQKCNLTLKLEVTAIKRKTGIDEEEASAYRTGDDRLMRIVEGDSSTPVIKLLVLKREDITEEKADAK